MKHYVLANMAPAVGRVLIWNAVLAVFLVVTVSAIFGIHSVTDSQLHRRGVRVPREALLRRNLQAGLGIGLFLCLVPNVLFSWTTAYGFPAPVYTAGAGFGTLLGVLLCAAIDLVCGIGIASLAGLAFVVSRRRFARAKD